MKDITENNSKTYKIFFWLLIMFRRDFYVFSNVSRYLIYFPNILQIIDLIYSTNRINSYYWSTNILRTPFGHFIIMSTCFDLTIIRLYLRFQIFRIVHQLAIKYSLHSIANKTKILSYYFNNSSSLMKKDM